MVQYDIMTTPALVINEKVVVKGRVPSAEEIKQLLTK
jgi:protein-disulfide isomerase